ncbi:hypothetical protein BJX61DRAFT_534100 [Aspergillus egyptiacus]|nr:hypothetical protein BJX61DRAFT_534100 [Aspergillus egyptiacus]
MADLPIHPPSFTSYAPQSESPLFTTLPAELRTEIFTYALSPYEDPQARYQKHTYWTRPGSSAPLTTCTALLRTCKAIYAETWFLPFALSEHTFYLTARDRAPEDSTSNAGSRRRSRTDPAAFQRSLDLIKKIHGDVIETGTIRVFAQLYILEPGDRLQQLLDTRYFTPRRIQLTLRYTDFWLWENNQRLYVDARWVNRVRFPDSVACFVVDFESLERRSGEVDILVRQAVDGWFFRRKDGRVLAARKDDVVVSRWTGSSVFGNRRWIRDEARPGQLDYYVATVAWRLAPEGVEVPQGECPKIQVSEEYRQPPPPNPGWRSFMQSELEEAGVTMDMAADQVVERACI